MTYRYIMFLCVCVWSELTRLSFCCYCSFANYLLFEYIPLFLSCCTGEIVFPLFPSTERLNSRMSSSNAGASGDLFLLRCFSSTDAGHKKSLKPAVLGWSEESLSTTTPVYTKESAWSGARAFGFPFFDGVICFNAFPETHRWSSSRSGARLPASSCVARKPTQRYVSGLRAHWPGAGEKWHHAGLRTQWPGRSPLPSQSPSIYAVPERYDKGNNCYEGAENKWKLAQCWPRACTFFCLQLKNFPKDQTMNHPAISEPLLHSVLTGFCTSDSDVNWKKIIHRHSWI